MPIHEMYQQALNEKGFTPDQSQQVALESLSQLHDNLTRQPLFQEGGIRQLLRKLRGHQQEPIPGLYLWGGVGRGKTFLFDLFFNNLPFEEKLRLHFHRFMQLVHDELKQLKHVSDPLDIVARHFAAKARVLCLDEMHVNDITDAMLIHGLLKGLIERGVTLVTTSNRPPDDLYHDGLQRARFLPAIELMKQHCAVLEMDSGTDYRLRTLQQAEIYHTPLDAEATACLEENFHNLAGVESPKANHIEINHREIPVVRWVDGVAWFDFHELCDSPRSSDDYIEIARYFHTVLIGNVPQMNEQKNDAARRFVNMVDEFYDRNVKLVISAEVVPEKLYRGKRLGFEFERAVSRLKEMQSRDYLALTHIP